MSDIKDILTPLIEGDIFLATNQSGASLICIITSVSDTRIEAINIATQHHIDFSRITGVSDAFHALGECWIDAIEALPSQVHRSLIGLSNKIATEVDDLKMALTQSEKEALI